MQGTELPVEPDTEVDPETETSVKPDSKVVKRTEHSDDQNKENHQVREGESHGEQIDLPTEMAETTEPRIQNPLIENEDIRIVLMTLEAEDPKDGPEIESPESTDIVTILEVEVTNTETVPKAKEADSNLKESGRSNPQTKKLGQTTQDKLHKQGEYFEEEIKIEELPENGPEGGVGTVVTESENTQNIEVIKVEDEFKIEIKMETETEDNNEAGREVEEESSWMEEPNNQSEKEDDTSSITTEVFDVNLVNMDLAELDWVESGNETDVTVKWEPMIETINLNEPEVTLSNNAHSLGELTQESEDEESLSSLRIRKTYVAMESAKVEKVVRRKRRKRPKGNQWRVDSEDTEWTPKKKKAMKIVLVKTKQDSSSESEDGRVPPNSWKRNHHKWLVKEKEDMKQNKILTELKQKADKQERENQRRV